MLSKEEVDTLALSCFSNTCKPASGFPDDILIGDRYFIVRRDRHNLILTRCQTALAKDMQNKIGGNGMPSSEAAWRNISRP